MGLKNMKIINNIDTNDSKIDDDINDYYDNNAKIDVNVDDVYQYNEMPVLSYKMIGELTGFSPSYISRLLKEDADLQ